MIYSLVHGVVSLVWNVLESIAEFVGASVHFVICTYKLFLSLYLPQSSLTTDSLADSLNFLANILIIGLIALGVVLYKDRNKRGTLGNDLKKKSQ